jgi:hypothetical protein
MERISAENQSPQILACASCGHRETAEIQIPPPWKPSKVKSEPHFPQPDLHDRLNQSDDRWSRYDPSGTPVTVGKPGEETKVIPFAWILIAGIVLVSSGLLVHFC